MTAYNLLLRLYPASFRNEYGDEMRAVFAREWSRTSGFAVIAFWVSTIRDAITNAAAVHFDVLGQDLAYTARVLRRTPGFALTAVAIVALGIGATTAAFSVTDFVLIRPLPFPDSDRLVKVWEVTPGYAGMELSPANYRDWKKAARSFESSGVYYTNAANMIGRGEPQRLIGAWISADLFPTLAVAPLIGRTFTAADDRGGAPATMILSYRLWQTEFGGSRDILGQVVVLDGTAHTIIGVMPSTFNFPTAETMFWTPQRFTEDNYRDRNDNWLEAVARLHRGVTVEQARAEIVVLAGQTRQQYPIEMKDTSATIIGLRDELSRRSRLLLVALSGAAACVLLIVCANVANLFLARAVARRRELAVRTALGAGRERLVRQLITESLLLAGIGGALGVGIAAAAVPLLSQLVPSRLPVASVPSIDARALAAALALTGFTGIMFGLAPAVRPRSDADLDALRDSARVGGGARERLRSQLVVAEILASVVLLVSTGLLIRALWRIQTTDPGFRSEGVLTMRTPLPLPQYGPVAVREGFYLRVLSEVRVLPGVTNAGFITSLPMTRLGGIWPVSIKGRVATRAADQVAALRYVTPGYFATLSIPLKRGRDVSESDTRDRQAVAVVSESFVRRYYPDEDPIGRHFMFALSDRVVVGVVGDVRFRGLESQNEPQVYLSYKQVDDNAIIGYVPRDLAIKATVPPATLAPAVRAVIRSVDPRLPVSDVRTLEDIVALQTASRSVQLRVIAAFAIVAAILAAIGIHGVLSFAVSQRAQEIGVRMALGAQARDIVSMIVWRSVRLAIAGLIPGILVAYWAGRQMEALLAGVKPTDAVTLVAAVALSLLMTVLGSLAPTLAAVRVDPIRVLKTE
jgi:putative ABC transport system permease protein